MAAIIDTFGLWRLKFGEDKSLLLLLASQALQGLDAAAAAASTSWRVGVHMPLQKDEDIQQHAEKLTAELQGKVGMWKTVDLVIAVGSSAQSSDGCKGKCAIVRQLCPQFACLVLARTAGSSAACNALYAVLMLCSLFCRAMQLPALVACCKLCSVTTGCGQRA